MYTYVHKYIYIAIRHTYIYTYLHIHVYYNNIICDWILENRPRCHILKCSGEAFEKNHRIYKTYFNAPTYTYIIQASQYEISDSCDASMQRYGPFHRCVKNLLLHHYTEKPLLEQSDRFVTVVAAKVA